MAKRTCGVLGCSDPVKGHGLCSMHYQRWRKTGSVDAPARMTRDERFWSKVARDGADACWVWTGSTYSNGYGQFFLSRNEDGCSRFALAHRYAYEAMVGPIPDGLVLDHLCRNRVCVNPEHLEPVTNRENLVRGEGFVAEQARQTECRRGGHPLSGDNLRVNNRGERICVTCDRAAAKRRR